jgi:hypothetical protein
MKRIHHLIVLAILIAALPMQSFAAETMQMVSVLIPGQDNVTSPHGDVTIYAIKSQHSPRFKMAASLENEVFGVIVQTLGD